MVMTNLTMSELSQAERRKPCKQISIHLALLIKDLTRSCKHLLLSLLDLPSTSEDHVWKGYEAVTHRYAQVLTTLSSVAAQPQDPAFPQHLKEILEQVLLEVRDSPDISRTTTNSSTLSFEEASRSSRLVSGEKLHTLITGMLKDIRSQYDSYVHSDDTKDSSRISTSKSARSTMMSEQDDLLKRDSKYASTGASDDYPAWRSSSGGSLPRSKPHLTDGPEPEKVITLNLHLSTTSRSHTFTYPLSLSQLQSTFHSILSHTNPSLTTQASDLAIWKRVEAQKGWVRVREANMKDVKEGEVLRCSPRYGESPRGERRVLRQSVHSPGQSANAVANASSRIPMPKSPSADTIPTMPSIHATQLPRRTSSATSPPASHPKSSLVPVNSKSGDSQPQAAAGSIVPSSLAITTTLPSAKPLTPTSADPPASAPVQKAPITPTSNPSNHASALRPSTASDFPPRRPSVASISSSKSSVHSAYRRTPPLPRPNQPLPTLPKDQMPIKLRREKEREEEIQRLKVELANVNEELRQVQASQTLQRRQREESESLKSDLEKLKRDHLGHIAKLEAQLAQAQAQLVSARSEVNGQHDHYTSLQTQRDQLQSQLSAKAELLAINTSQLETQRSEVSKLKQDCIKKDEQISRLSQRVVSQMDKLKAKDEEVLRERKQVEDRQAQAELHRKHVQRMALRMAKQKEGMERQSKDLAEAKAALQDMASQVRKLQNAFAGGMEVVKKEMASRLSRYESTALGISSVGDETWTPSTKQRTLKTSSSTVNSSSTMVTGISSATLLDQMKVPIESKKEEVKQRLESLSESLATTRSEITQFGNIPEESHLASLTREAESIQIHLDACSTLLDKKALKKGWESSIAGVVTEQGYVQTLQEEFEDIDESLEDVKEMLKKIKRIAEIVRAKPKAQQGLLRRASVSRAENRAMSHAGPYSPPPTQDEAEQGQRRSRSKTGSGKKKVRLVVEPVDGNPMTRRHTVSPRSFVPPPPPDMPFEEIQRLMIEELKNVDITPEEERLSKSNQIDQLRMEKIERHKKEEVPLQRELNMFFEADSMPSTPKSDVDSGRDTPTGFRNKIGVTAIEEMREERNQEILKQLYKAQRRQKHALRSETDEGSEDQQIIAPKARRKGVGSRPSSEESTSSTTTVAHPPQTTRPHHRHQLSSGSTATTSPATSETLVPSPTSTGDVANNPAFDIKLQHFANHDALDRHQGSNIPLPQISAASAPHIDFARKHHQRTHAFSYPSARVPGSKASNGEAVDTKPGMGVKGILQQMNSPPTVQRDTTTVLARRSSDSHQHVSTVRRHRPKRPESIASEYGKPRYSVVVPQGIR